MCPRQELLSITFFGTIVTQLLRKALEENKKKYNEIYLHYIVVMSKGHDHMMSMPTQWSDSCGYITVEVMLYKHYVKTFFS